MATKQQAYFEKHLPYAQAVEKKYGVPVSVTLAMSALESSWGSSGLTTKANNYFGIKNSSSWDGAIYTAGTKEEYTPGVITSVTAAFRKYNSDLDSFMDYGDFLTSNQRYSGAFKTDNSYDFVRAVADAGYATDKSYYDKVSSTMKANNLTQYDGSGKNIDIGDIEVDTGNWFLDFAGNLGADAVDGLTDDETGELSPDIPSPSEVVGSVAKSGTRILFIVIIIVVLIVAVFFAIKSGGTKQ
ncbi:glycoside hydrolase family 73 protein [Erysipelothrix tonsillarum]|uniref:glycoside hydrolase family 73 protein n=1 Tax=Erysipelothrix tonsillarum TaxID=38402 RepID=UPI0039C81330